TNLTLTNLLPQARLMAGKAAMARTAYKQATNYFSDILTSECATNLKVEATFAYADANIGISTQDPTNRTADLREAIGSLATITNKLPGTSQAAQASGRIGDCYYDWGSWDASQYTNATNAYYAVLENTNALPEARSEARFQIACTIEKQAGQ